MISGVVKILAKFSRINKLIIKFKLILANTHTLKHTMYIYIFWEKYEFFYIYERLGHIQHTKKYIFSLYFFFLYFCKAMFGKNLIFLEIKLPKTSLRGVC